MDIVTVLSNIALLEGMLAEVYESLGEKFSYNEEIRRFFLKLGMDESSHRDLAKFQIRVMRNEHRRFPDVDIDKEHLQDIFLRVHEFKKNMAPTIEESLQFAVEIESSLAERYVQTVMNQVHAECADLIKSLCSGCKKHYESCREMAGRYHVQTGTP